MATEVIVGRAESTRARLQGKNGSILDVDYVGVKAPQFSFTRLDGADPTLGVEMASTGEVACLGDDFEEAFLKALLAVGYRLPVRAVLLSTGPVESKAAFLESCRTLIALGVRLYATRGTAEFLSQNGITSTTLHWPLEHASPNVTEYLQAKAHGITSTEPAGESGVSMLDCRLIRNVLRSLYKQTVAG